jgi:hypothetical protein
VHVVLGLDLTGKKIDAQCQKDRDHDRYYFEHEIGWVDRPNVSGYRPIGPKKGFWDPA